MEQQSSCSTMYRIYLEDLDLLNGILFDLAKADSQDAVLQDGFDVIFFDWHRQSNSTGELTPVALLQEVILYFIFIAGRQGAADSKLVIRNADIEVILVDTGSTRLDNETFLRLVYIDG